MPKFTCECGEPIHLRAVPHSQTFALAWEPHIETFMNELLTLHQQATSDDEFYRQAYLRSTADRTLDVIQR
ncbi:MAG: hypothetical protein KME45_02020 [Stenomitos rutilans HA7619-LM2]|nr:hypothetical protein [Stenomitos rutilans HA7619-LM2]